MGGYESQATGGAPIKSWTRGVIVEDQALQQLRNVASLPFIFEHVAAMPDCHWGMARRSAASSRRRAPSYQLQSGSILDAE
jgi:hypothetical protein